MLPGCTFCVPLKTTAAEVVQAYGDDDVYAKFGGSSKILSHNGTEFKNCLFTNVTTQLGVEHKVYSSLFILNQLEEVILLYYPPLQSIICILK